MDSVLGGLLYDGAREVCWYRCVCRVVSDGHDEDVSAARHCRDLGSGIVGRRVRRYDLTLGQGDVAFGANRHNEMLAVRLLSLEADYQAIFSTHARLGFERQNQHESAAEST